MCIFFIVSYVNKDFKCKSINEKNKTPLFGITKPVTGRGL